MAELQEQAAEYETIAEEEKEEQAEERTLSRAASATVYKDECCWQCKQRGHTRANCKRPPRKFCSQRWRANQRMSSPTWKRHSNRGYPGEPPVQPIYLDYRPRPFVRVTIQRRTVDVLIDTEVEISLVSPDIAQTANSRTTSGERIRLANGEITHHENHDANNTYRSTRSPPFFSRSTGTREFDRHRHKPVGAAANIARISPTSHRSESALNSRCHGRNS